MRPHWSASSGSGAAELLDSPSAGGGGGGDAGELHEDEHCGDNDDLAACCATQAAGRANVTRTIDAAAAVAVNDADVELD